MKDNYGYISTSQKNYDPKYPKHVVMKARQYVKEGELQIQVEVEIHKEKNGNLYSEFGSIVLSGEKLAEFAELFKN